MQQRSRLVAAATATLAPVAALSLLVASSTGAQAAPAHPAGLTIGPTILPTAVPTVVPVKIAGGQLYAWGRNAKYNLGDGTTLDRSTPVPIKGMNHVTSVGEGIALDFGSVYTWGNDNSGALGNGPATGSVSTPTKLVGLTGVVKVASYGDARYVVKSDGSVWDWGANNWRQLGDGTTTNRNSPAKVPGLSHVVSVAAGLTFAVALKSDGTVWGWGSGVYGYFHYLENNTDGSGTPVQLKFPAKVTAIGAGEDNSFAVSGGKVWALGSNDNETTGVNSQTTLPADKQPVQVVGLSGVTQVAENGTTSYAATSLGQPKSWGFNNGGALGNGTSWYASATPVSIGLKGVTAVAADQGPGEDSSFDPLASAGYALTGGHVFSWGVSNYGELGTGVASGASASPVQIASLSNVTAIAGGRYCGFAVVG